MKATPLERASWEAERAHRVKDQELDELLDKEVAAAKERVNATPLAKEVAALKQRAAEARLAVQDEEERLAKEGIGAPVPLGTKLKKEQVERWSRRVDVVAYGVMEAVTKDSVFPSNRYAPRPGSFIVRYLKKDGSLGSRFEDATRSLPWGWKPVDPSVKVAEAR